MNDLFTLEDVGILEQGELIEVADRISFLAFMFGYNPIDLDEPEDSELISAIDECLDWLNDTATDGSVTFVRNEDNSVEIVEV